MKKFDERNILKKGLHEEVRSIFIKEREVRFAGKIAIIHQEEFSEIKKKLKAFLL